MLGLGGTKKANEGLVGVSMGPGGIALAHVYNDGNWGLGACELLDAGSARQGGGKDAGLEERVGELDLRRSRCSVALNTADYQLLLVEAPRVESEEMAAAVRWKVKDLIDRPIETVAIEVFPVPEDAYRGKNGMIYAVVAPKSRLIEIRDLIEAAGLVLETIDIPELVMRNLSSVCADDSNGLAFLDLRASGSTLNLCKDGNIYLTRHLNTAVDDTAMDSEQWQAVRERLILEIQRSLDYYESQMGQSQVARLIVSPGGRHAPSLARELDDAMAVTVETMDLSTCLHSRLALTPDIQHDCLLAIGAALRPHGEAA